MKDSYQSTVCAILLVDIAVCLALLVLFAIITVKSHCCDRQYSRKQRIFLYLLLASLGNSITNLLYTYGTIFFRDSVYLGFTALFNVLFCCAALYVCFEVYTTLRRTEFRCLRFRFHTFAEEMCFLIVVTAISAGDAAVGAFVGMDDRALNIIVVGLPPAFPWLIAFVCVVLVLVQLCVACRRVEGGQVANRLRRPAVVTVTLLVFLVGYFLGLCVMLGIDLHVRGKAAQTWFLVSGSIYALCYKAIPYMFVIFFGWTMLLDLGRQCCCRRYRRRRGYGQIPGQEERGVLSVQTGVPSTTRTYYTCDDVTSATYYTCDESQAPEWFAAVPAPDPPV